MTTAGPSVAVIGGGISGLVCGARLQQLGIRNVTVFDTGRNSTGGRCSSRSVMINGKQHIFDHSAQYFTVSHQGFANIVSFLHKKGAVKIWKGPIGHVNKSGQFHEDRKLYQAFIGTNGMVSIPECLASLVNVKRPVWVANVSWEESCKKWKVDRHGYFDYLVIAHNGKCADKLMSNAGAPEIHTLLRTRFSDTVNPRDQRMHLCSLWALLVAFPKSLGLPYQGAHADNDTISWIANNTAKLQQQNSNPAASELECWTIFSTRRFGTQHKVSQEAIPPGKSEEVTNLMLRAFAKVTKQAYDSLKPVYTRVQLWGAAVPINTLQHKDDCVFDGRHHVGICGDWITSPCLQGAAVSGLAVAEKIKAHSEGQPSDTRLDARFTLTATAAIGDFPTDAKMIFKPGS